MRSKWRVSTVLLAACATILFAATFATGPGREFLAALLFVLAMIAALLAFAGHRRFGGEETRGLTLLAILVFPLIAMGGGVDLPETVHPIEYVRDPEYREAAHDRWRASKWRFLGDLLGLLAILFLAACVIGFWVAAVYVVIHLIRHGTLPSWV